MNTQFSSPTPSRLVFAAFGFFAALGVLSLTHVPVHAQSPDVTIATLAAQLNADEVRLTADETKIASLQLTARGQAVILTDLHKKTAPLSLSGTDLTISGVNVHIVSGSGRTDDGTVDAGGNLIAGKSLTGLGNLIIGYNALQNDPNYPDVRTGSHNLILGDGNNYSSFGGLVTGLYNTVSGPYASISGGAANTTSGILASISGGMGLTQDTLYGWSAGSLGSAPISGNFSSP